MGLFSKKDNCCICEIEKGKAKILDGFICKSCMKKCSVFISPFEVKSFSREKIIEAINESQRNERRLKEFSPTRNIEKVMDIDENKKQWKVFIPNVVFDYSDIINYELLEDGESITKGGIGNAIAGGVLFGGVGAIVGGVTGKKKNKKIINRLEVKIVTRHPFASEVRINLLTTGNVKADSILYKSAYQKAQNYLTALDRMIDQNEENINVQSSPADEIIKYKKLLDDSIITQEEFEAKKKQLLGV